MMMKIGRLIKYIVWSMNIWIIEEKPEEKNLLNQKYKK
jgi:hypothetical protein